MAAHLFPQQVVFCHSDFSFHLTSPDLQLHQPDLSYLNESILESHLATSTSTSLMLTTSSSSKTLSTSSKAPISVVTVNLSTSTTSNSSCSTEFPFFFRFNTIEVDSIYFKW